MPRPPGRKPTTKPTGGDQVSANVADQAAAAIKRAGFVPTPGRIRMVIRAQQAAGELPATDFDWWDRLVRALPLNGRRATKTAPRAWRTAS